MRRPTEAQIRDAIERRITAYQLAGEVGCSRTAVMATARELGLSFRGQRGRVARLTRDVLLAAREKHGTGYGSKTAAAADLKCSKAGLRDALRREGVDW